jgi:uncharacterized membrane protein
MKIMHLFTHTLVGAIPTAIFILLWYSLFNTVALSLPTFIIVSFLVGAVLYSGDGKSKGKPSPSEKNKEQSL